MNTEVILGRPPLDKTKKRTVRRVATFTPPEAAEIDDYLEQTGMGVNELIRGLVLEEVRAHQQDSPTEQGDD